MDGYSAYAEARQVGGSSRGAFYFFSPAATVQPKVTGDLGTREQHRSLCYFLSSWTGRRV